MAEQKRPLQIPRYLKDAENELSLAAIRFEQGKRTEALSAIIHLEATAVMLRGLLGDTDAR